MKNSKKKNESYDFFIFLLSVLPAKIYKFIYLPAMIADIFGLFMVKSFEKLDHFLSSYDIFQGLLIPMCHFIPMCQLIDLIKY